MRLGFFGVQTNLIKLSLNDMNVTRQGTEVIVDIFCAEVACDEDVLDLVGHLGRKELR